MLDESLVRPRKELPEISFLQVGSKVGQQWLSMYRLMSLGLATWVWSPQPTAGEEDEGLVRNELSRSLIQHVESSHTEAPSWIRRIRERRSDRTSPCTAPSKTSEVTTGKCVTRKRTWGRKKEVSVSNLRNMLPSGHSCHLLELGMLDSKKCAKWGWPWWGHWQAGLRAWLLLNLSA